MTESTDPFGDLDESLADDPDEDSQGATTEATTDMHAETPETTTDDPQNRPAFPFDQATQDALYARKEAWQAFEDTLDFDVKRELRDRGYENIEGRELHDAALRVLARHAEEVADEVERQRK
jgi:hypothetical protein